MDSELAGLDLAVAKIEGWKWTFINGEDGMCYVGHSPLETRQYSPARNIAEAMRLLIDRELILIPEAEGVQICSRLDRDQPSVSEYQSYSNHSGDKLRSCCVAICRAVIASKESEGG